MTLLTSELSIWEEYSDYLIKLQDVENSPFPHYIWIIVAWMEVTLGMVFVCLGYLYLWDHSKKIIHHKVDNRQEENHSIAKLTEVVLNYRMETNKIGNSKNNLKDAKKGVIAVLEELYENSNIETGGDVNKARKKVMLKIRSSLVRNPYDRQGRSLALETKNIFCEFILKKRPYLKLLTQWIFRSDHWKHLWDFVCIFASFLSVLVGAAVFFNVLMTNVVLLVDFMTLTRNIKIQNLDQKISENIFETFGQNLFSSNLNMFKNSCKTMDDFESIIFKRSPALEKLLKEGLNFKFSDLLDNHQNLEMLQQKLEIFSQKIELIQGKQNYIETTPSQVVFHDSVARITEKIFSCTSMLPVSDSNSVEIIKYILSNVDLGEDAHSQLQPYSLQVQYNLQLEIVKEHVSLINNILETILASNYRNLAKNLHNQQKCLVMLTNYIEAIWSPTNKRDLISSSVRNHYANATVLHKVIGHDRKLNFILENLVGSVMVYITLVILLVLLKQFKSIFMDMANYGHWPFLTDLTTLIHSRDANLKVFEEERTTMSNQELLKLSKLHNYNLNEAKNLSMKSVGLYVAIVLFLRAYIDYYENFLNLLSTEDVSSKDCLLEGETLLNFSFESSFISCLLMASVSITFAQYKSYSIRHSADMEFSAKFFYAIVCFFNTVCIVITKSIFYACGLPFFFSILIIVLQLIGSPKESQEIPNSNPAIMTCLIIVCVIVPLSHIPTLFTRWVHTLTHKYIVQKNLHLGAEQRGGYDIPGMDTGFMFLPRSSNMFEDLMFQLHPDFSYFSNNTSRSIFRLRYKLYIVNKVFLHFLHLSLSWIFFHLLHITLPSSHILHTKYNLQLLENTSIQLVVFVGGVIFGPLLLLTFVLLLIFYRQFHAWTSEGVSLGFEPRDLWWKKKERNDNIMTWMMRGLVATTSVWYNPGEGLEITANLSAALGEGRWHSASIDDNDMEGVNDMKELDAGDTDSITDSYHFSMAPQVEEDDRFSEDLNSFLSDLRSHTSSHSGNEDIVSRLVEERFQCKSNFNVSF